MTVSGAVSETSELAPHISPLEERRGVLGLRTLSASPPVELRSRFEQPLLKQPFLALADNEGIEFARSNGLPALPS
jgi:hypothetical protein